MPPTSSHRKPEMFLGYECEMLLEEFQRSNGNPSKKTLAELANEMGRDADKIEEFFEKRRSVIAKRKMVPYETATCMSHLRSVELRILEARHAERIPMSDSDIWKLEELMDVKHGTYQLFFKNMVKPRQRFEKARLPRRVIAKRPEKPQPLPKPVREIKPLSHFVMTKNNWKREGWCRAPAPEECSNLEKDTNELISTILLNQSDDNSSEQSEQLEQLDQFELHSIKNKIHVFIKLNGMKTARWVFATDASVNMKNAEVSTVMFGDVEVAEIQKRPGSLESVTYALCSNPISAAQQFIILISRSFSSPLQKVVAAEPENPYFQKVLDLPEVKECKELDLLAHNRMTEVEFETLVRRFWTCSHLTITAVNCYPLSLKERFPGVLNVCIRSPFYFQQMHLNNINWNNTHLDIPLKATDLEITTEEINEYLHLWMQTKSAVDSIRFFIPRVSQEHALLGLPKITVETDSEENKDLYNSRHGYLRDNNWTPILYIVNKSGVLAGIYCEEDFIDFIVWKPKTD